MQILLASAKMMTEKVARMLLPTPPLFQQEAKAFARDMAEYDEATLAEKLHCSRAIAAQCKARYQRMVSGDAPVLPAALAYTGQAYKHLRVGELTDEDLQWANQHLWHTSFLYGLLRPLEGISPYRLEGNLSLPSGGGETMFGFWRSRLTDVLVKAVKADDGVLVHLATEEFQHLFDWHRVCREVEVIQPLFYVRQGKALKIQAVWAKTCRGAMTRYIIQNRISRVEDLKAFAYEGFAYRSDLGECAYPHFVRE